MTTIATECNVCPEGIKMCAHFDGKVVWLGDETAAAPHNGTSPVIRHWSVLGPSATEKCACSADHIVISASEAFGTNSLADAEAEFRRRERLLLET